VFDGSLQRGLADGASCRNGGEGLDEGFVSHSPGR
jgi:hypothetical protein